MAEVVRYVDPDASGAGSGTSWTDAYTSLSAWNAGEETNLVADGDWHHVYVRASLGGNDTTAFDIDGWTTDATHNIVIEAASTDYAEKTGFDASKYVFTDTRQRIKGAATYVKYYGVQFGASPYSNVVSCDLDFGTGTVLFRDCLFYSDDSSSEDVEINNMDVVTFENCIFYGDVGTEDYGIQCLDADCTVNIYHCVMRDRSTGIYITNGTINIKNCAVFSCTDDINDNSGGAATVTIDYCATDDGDGTNAVAPASSDWDNEFVDSAGGDFTLLATGNCYHGGVTGTGVSTDIEGDNYDASTPSIGVDEYVAAGGVAPTGALAGPLVGPMGGPIWR